MGALPGVFFNLGSGCPQPTTTSIHMPEQQIPAPHRRSALLFLSLPAVTAFFSIPSRAAAFSISIMGPKDWLREQKKKAARFVLAPIESSRQTLRNAYLLLDSESPVEDAGELLKTLKFAARDCIPRDRNSFVTFQASTGVEVCTFALIVKNAASLLDVGDPLKLEAETKLDDLIRSFSFLGGTIDNCDIRVTSDREKVKIDLMQSISALDKFEQGVKDCLGV